MTALNGLKDLIPWIWTFGGSVIDDQGKVTLGDEGSVKALEWYKSLLDRGLMPPKWTAHRPPALLAGQSGVL